jgi:choline dehydrogenase-like flavoprotein
VSARTTYDAVIVGSGPTGGYAAKALSEAGLHVLVLEAGATRLASETKQTYHEFRRRLGYLIEHDPAAVRRQRVQSSCYAWPVHPHAFVDDEDNPYTTEAGKPFAWIRCRQVGGRMVVRRHGLQFYRFSDQDFKAGERDGAGPSWPISYADLVPHYERVERWMKLHGTTDRLAQLPDSLLADTIELDAAQGLLASRLRRRWRDRVLIPGRTGAAPIPIRDAKATGRCTVQSNAIVTEIVTAASGSRVTGVRFVNPRNGNTGEASGRIIVLCASSIESARLLLASRTSNYPDGLANSSGVLGRYLMDHTHLGGITGDLEAPDDHRPAARWGYIPRFRNVRGPAESFVRGYGVQVFTDGRQVGLTAFGEMLPHADNRVTLDPAVTDRWGVPAARIACVHRENELAMARDAFQECSAILEAADIKPWRLNTRLSVPGLAIHEVGTARMGSDPRTSVLNSFCQSWDINNLFVMDGSCFVSQGVQNPTLTMLALAARSCDYLLDLVRRSDL